MILGLLQLPSAPSGSSQAFTVIWWAIGLLLLLGVALIVLLSKKREDVQLTNEKRATAAEGLVKVRDTELADTLKKLAKAVEDKEDYESEWRTLQGIIIKDLMIFWEQKTRIETDLAFAQSESRRLGNLVRRYEEEGYVIPKSNTPKRG